MRTGFFDLSTVANLGIESWTFARPVKIGDTIHLKITLKEKHWMAHQNAGVVFWKVKVINQRDETVASGIWKRLICENEENSCKNAENDKLSELGGGDSKPMKQF